MVLTLNFFFANHVYCRIIVLKQFVGSSSTLSSTFRRRQSGQFRSPALSRGSSGSIFSNATNAFSNSDSDVPDDTDAVSETDFEHREPLEIELSENSKEYFEELDSEFTSTRY